MPVPRSVFAAVSAAVAATVLAGCGGSSGPAAPGTAPAADAENGRRVFDASCAQCHGPGARGTDKGPPLVDRIYEPSHHGDASFLLAVRRGSPEHHWSFGDMPPVAGVADQEVADVVAYVRGLQEAAGIR